MQTIKAHFDGKVIVPDEPVDLPAGTPVTIELDLTPTVAVRPRTDFRDWIGLGDQFPHDPSKRPRSEDDLWHKDHE